MQSLKNLNSLSTILMALTFVLMVTGCKQEVKQEAKQKNQR